MGCDIHAHIEFQPYKPRGEDDWHTFASLRYEPRDYALFGALTRGEVRGEAMPDGPPLRGMPPQLGTETGEDYYETADRESDPATVEAEQELWRLELPRNAKIRVTQMGSMLWVGHGEPDRELHTTLHAWWPCPDYHSASWVTVDELEAVVHWSAAMWEREQDAYWLAVIAAMRALDIGGTPSRLVFWFDN